MKKKYFLEAEASVSENSVRIRNVAAIIFSLAYAFFLAALPMDKYVDRDNYINYVIDSADIFFFYVEKNVAGLFQNEPAWLILNIFLGYFFDPDFAVRLVIFFSALIFSVSIFRFEKKSFRFFVLAFAVCLLPQVMKNYIIHLRQGVAVALFVFAITSCSASVRRLGVFLPLLVHSSFFFVAINYFIALFGPRRLLLTDGLRFILILSFVLSINLMAFFLIDYSGARQVEEFSASDFEVGSGLAFLFWLAVLIIFLLDGARLEFFNFFAIISIASYLVLYNLFPPAARIFESVLPIVLMAGGKLEARWRKLFYLAFATIFLYQWIEPWYVGGDVFRLML